MTPKKPRGLAETVSIFYFSSAMGKHENNLKLRGANARSQKQRDRLAKQQFRKNRAAQTYGVRIHICHLFGK